MKDMNCKSCALKHIAAAISYGKEVISGHGKGAELDHRPDFIGELVNAEHHLEMLNPGLHVKVTSLRRRLQEIDHTPGIVEINLLRQFWLQLDTGNNGKTKKKPCTTCGKKRKADPVDIVIPLAMSGSHGNNLELRYALRSITQNLLNIDKIWLVTQKLPIWVKDVEHIEAKDQYNRKNINLYTGLVDALSNSAMSQNVLFWTDDNILLSKMNAATIPAIITNGDLAEYPMSGKAWNLMRRQTGDALKAANLPTKNYEAHVPVLFNRTKFLEIAGQFDLTAGYGLCYISVYQNAIQPKTVLMDQVKATFEKAVEPRTIKEKTASKIFMGYNDTAWESGVEQFLQERFPNPSRFEK